MVVLPESHQRVTRLTPLDEVFARIDGLAQPVLPGELPVTAALGRVLAADVTVAQPMPPHPLSLRDGWAVSSELVADAGPYLPVPLSPAPQWVEVREPLPSGADAVMPPDAVVTDAGGAEALAAVVPGEGVLAAGADAGPGRPLRRAGQIVRAVDIAVMDGLGIACVPVRVPRVRLVCGSPHGVADRTGMALIRHAIEADGGAVLAQQANRDEANLDEADLLADALVAAGADAVIVVGGVGMGRHELAVKTLARVGTVAIHGLGLKPGDHGAIGSVDARPALLLPGELGAALAMYLVVGRRLLARLTGRTPPAPDAVPAREAVLARKIVSTVGMAEVVLVRCRQDGVEHGVEPIAAEHFPLQAITHADGYVLVPAASEGYAAGSIVEMRPLP